MFTAIEVAGCFIANVTLVDYAQLHVAYPPKALPSNSIPLPSWSWARNLISICLDCLSKLWYMIIEQISQRGLLRRGNV